RETEEKGPVAVRRAQRAAYGWWRRLRWCEKATIAMVNGWCIGGAFGPLYACDLAITSDDAQFGLSEINWGILPGGGATKIATGLGGMRDARYRPRAGKRREGRRAAELRRDNERVPPDQRRARPEPRARVLCKKNPQTLKAAKDAVRRV